jgi:hypothetical protein
MIAVSAKSELARTRWCVLVLLAVLVGYPRRVAANASVSCVSRLKRDPGEFESYRFLNHCKVARPRLAGSLTPKLKGVDESRGDLRVRY